MHSAWDLLDTVLARLAQQRVRTAVAVLAVAVAVLGIVLVAGNILQARHAARRLAFAMFDLSTLTVAPPREGQADERTRPAREELDMADAAALRGVPGVTAAVPYQESSATAKSGREVSDLVMFGGPVALADALGCRMVSGRRITDQRGVAECLLTKDAARYLFAKDPLGETVRLNGRRATVVGVVDPGSSMPAPEAAIVGAALAGALTHAARPQAIILKVKLSSDADRDLALIRQVRQRAAAVLDQRFGRGVGAAMIRSDLDSVEAQLERLSTLAVAEAVFLMMGLLIAVATVAELLYADVQSDLVEIGVRRALGATAVHIWSEVAARGIIMCLLGGLVGIGLSFCYWMLPATIQQSLPWEASLSVDLLAIAMSLLAGVAASLVPAYEAIRTDPAFVLKEQIR